MNFRDMVKKMFRQRRPIHNAKRMLRRDRAQLQLEALEDRCVPTVVASVPGGGLFITAGPGEPNDIVVTPGLLTLVADAGASVLAVPPVIVPAVLEGLTIAFHTSVGVGAEVEIGFDIPILPVVFGDGVLAPPLFGEIAGGATADLFSLMQNEMSSSLNEDGASVVAGVEVPQSGDVFYKVAGKGTDVISSYQVYQAIVDPSNPQIDEVEYNNETLFATDIDIFDGNGVSRIVNGQFDEPGDVDFYQFTAGPGERLVVILDNNPERNGSTFTQTVATGSPLNADIPDNGQLLSTLNVDLAKGVIADLNVTLNIDHTNLDDLEVFLIGPGGERLSLVRNVGGTGDNFENTVLDDEVSTDIAAGSAPFTASFRPDRPLDAFDGLEPNGDWTLEINDTATGELGTLIDWSLDFTINNQDDNKATTYLALLDASGVPVTGFDLFAANNDFFKHGDNISGDEGNAVGAFDVGIGGTFFVVVADTGIGADNTYRFVVLKTNTLVDESTTVTVASTNVPLVIPDTDPGTIVSTLTLGPTSISGKITDINITLDIPHTFDDDLDVFLEHPDGTIVELFTDVGGSDDNFTGTTLDDEAGTDITSGSAPFSGTFRPEGNLSDFDGKDPRGTWKLHVTDDAGDDVGTLNSWSLTITTDDAPKTTTGATSLGGGEFGDGEIKAGDIDFYTSAGANSGDLLFSYVDTHNASLSTNFGFSVGSIDSTLAVLADDGTTEIASADNGGPPGTSNASRDSLNDALEEGGIDFDALGTPTAAIITVDLGEDGNDTRDNKLDLYAIQAATQFIKGGRGTEEIKTGGGNVFVDTFGGPDIIEVNIAFDSTNTWNAGEDVDELRVPANPSGDIIDIEFTGATTFIVTVNGVVAEYNIPDAALEQIIVYAGAGDDILTVRGEIPEFLTEGIDFLGGAGLDKLIYLDEGPGSTFIHRQEHDQRDGSVSIGTLPSVNYESVEFVTISPHDPVTGGTGTDDLDGRVVVMDIDPFEANNSILNPTDFTLFRAVHLHPAIDGHVAFDIDEDGTDDVDQPDEDWYRFRAPFGSTFTIDLLFDKVGELANGEDGLPGDGDLEIEVYDASKTLVATTSVVTATGKQISFGEGAGEDFYLRVFGATPDSINSYDLAESHDEAGPQVTDVFITSDPNFDLFEVKPTAGPTPLIFSLTVNITDFLERHPGTAIPALAEAIAENPGHFILVGDHVGQILIDEIIVTNLDNTATPTVGDPATATIELRFNNPLPDDRYTFTIQDSIVDPSGNALDGESNADQPGQPTFPSGNGIAGGDFIARFTVDSRPEIASWAEGRIIVDINGNGVHDPHSTGDSTNKDLAFTMGLVSDIIFVGNFNPVGGQSLSSFDKFGVYGRKNGVFRFLLDFDGDGLPDIIIRPTAQINGKPVAGNFNAAHPGDEIGVFDGAKWYLDTNGDNDISGADRVITGPLRGYPITGDFDRDGRTDLATYQPENDLFQIDFAADGLGNLDDVVHFGFAGVRERPIAHDMDGDGFTDLGLWVPTATGADWYFLVSGGSPVTSRVAQNGVLFSPAPLGKDIVFTFGPSFAVPVVGNFDPPVGATSTPATPITVPDITPKFKQNLTLTANVQLAGAGSSAGLISRYSPEGDMYVAWVVERSGSFFVEICSKIDGQLFTLSSTQVSSGSGKLTFKTKGNELKVLWNNRLLATVTNTSLTNGFFGKWSSAGTRLKNFEADFLPSSAPIAVSLAASSQEERQEASPARLARRK